MNIHEYQAKAILKKFNVPVPKGEILLSKRNFDPVSSTQSVSICSHVYISMQI